MTGFMQIIEGSERPLTLEEMFVQSYNRFAETNEYGINPIPVEELKEDRQYYEQNLAFLKIFAQFVQEGQIELCKQKIKQVFLDNPVSKDQILLNEFNPQRIIQ